MIWREKERSFIRAVQMYNLRGLLDIRRMDKVLNAQIRQLCGVTKGVDEKIDESVFQWFCYVKKMGNGSISKGECIRCCLGDEPLTLMRWNSLMKP